MKFSLLSRHDFQCNRFKYIVSNLKDLKNPVYAYIVYSTDKNFDQCQKTNKPRGEFVVINTNRKTVSTFHITLAQIVSIN